MSIASRPGTFRGQSKVLLGCLGQHSDRNLGAVTPVSGGLFRAVNSFGPKDHEGAGAGSRTYNGGGRAGHIRGAGVSIPGDVLTLPRTRELSLGSADVASSLWVSSGLRQLGAGLL